jgi:hypothetical protein
VKRAALIGALLSACAATALAHDTWFVPEAATPRGELALALGTGNQFPKLELPVAIEQVQASGCQGEGVRAEALRRLGDRGDALLMRTARPVPATAVATCWAQLVPIDITIEPPIVERYFAEIRPPEAVRARWAELQARGIGWQERYVKHARIEIDGLAPPPGPIATTPLPLGMDVLMRAPRRPVRVGDVVEFQVLRDGQPLADFPVELRSDLSPAGIWHRTDAEGRVRQALPLAARWILRGTDVRASTTQADAWQSRFVTLAFEVRAP